MLVHADQLLRDAPSSHTLVFMVDTMADRVFTCLEGDSRGQSSEWKLPLLRPENPITEYLHRASTATNLQYSIDTAKDVLIDLNMSPLVTFRAVWQKAQLMMAK